MSAVSVRVFQLVLAGAASRGVDPSALLHAAGLSGEELVDPDGRLSRAAELRMWTQAALATGDEWFGIHLCEQMPVGSMGPLGFAVRSSATLGDAYHRVIRFLRLLVQGPLLELRVEGDVARLRHRAPPTGPAPSRHAVEFLLGNMVVLARKGVGATLVPRAVSFRHAGPSRIDPYHALFGRNVRFDQPHDEIVLDRELLARPQQQADPPLASVLDRHLSSLLGSTPADGSFLERVDAALAAELEHGEPTVGAIASRLHMSPRTLQRHLGREGTSLSERLDRIRETLATRLLGEPHRSIAEVAFLLGFSEVSTFHRAFKRWTGVTPGAHRRGGEA